MLQNNQEKRVKSISIAILLLAASIFSQAADAPGPQPANDSNDAAPDEAGNSSSDLHLKPEVLAARKKARARIDEDGANLGRIEVQAIEKSFNEARQVGDESERKKSLKAFIAKNKKCNRTGCAMLMLAAISGNGPDSVKILQDAVKDYSDCYFNDGAQVGGCGRYMLARRYMLSGDKNKAAKLLLELKKSYPDAVDHAGNKLVDTMLDDFGVKFVNGLK